VGEEINNTTLLGDASLTFMTEDSRTTEEGTIDAVQMFVDQGLPAIIGLASSAQLKKAYPIAHERDFHRRCRTSNR
jgi:ABC-type branched-subunit amino acid transport system substrate-binding protein